MSADLITRLSAALDAEEQAARAAAGAYGDTWTARDEGWVRSNTGADVLSEPDAPTEHIAAHDPAFVLADIAAKRAVLAEAFALAAKIDGEWACCHSAEQIERGECESESPDDMPIVRALAEAYGIA